MASKAWRTTPPVVTSLISNGTRPPITVPALRLLLMNGDAARFAARLVAAAG